MRTILLLGALLLFGCDSPVAPTLESPYDPQGPLALPGRPQNFRLEAATSTSVTLAWDDRSTIEEGYLLERADNVGGRWRTYRQLPPNAQRFTDTLTLAQPYRYRLRALRKSVASQPESLAVSYPQRRTTLPGTGASLAVTPRGEVLVGGAAFSVLQLSDLSRVGGFDTNGQLITALKLSLDASLVLAIAGPRVYVVRTDGTPLAERVFLDLRDAAFVSTTAVFVGRLKSARWEFGRGLVEDVPIAADVLRSEVGAGYRTLVTSEYVFEEGGAVTRLRALPSFATTSVLPPVGTLSVSAVGGTYALFTQQALPPATGRTLVRVDLQTGATRLVDALVGVGAEGSVVPGGLTPDGRLASVTMGGQAYVVDAAANRVVQAFAPAAPSRFLPGGTITAATITPDGTAVLTLSGSTLTVFPLGVAFEAVPF